MTFNQREKTEALESLIQRVRDGKRPMGISTAIHSSVPIEMAAHHGYEWVIVDQEHTLLTGMQVIEQIRTADYVRMPAIVKVNQKDPILIRDAMDAGASGIQLPDVNTPEDLERGLKDMQYVRTGGNRGFCPIQRSVNYSSPKYSEHYQDWGKLEEEFSKKTLLIPTVETREGMLNLDAMLQYDECPIWHLGPNDLAESLGIEDMPDVINRTILQIALKIHNAGKFLSLPMMIDPIENGEKVDPVASAAALISTLQVDMPYTADSFCLAYGLSIMGRAGHRSVLDTAEAKAKKEAKKNPRKKSDGKPAKEKSDGKPAKEKSDGKPLKAKSHGLKVR